MVRQRRNILEANCFVKKIFSHSKAKWMLKMLPQSHSIRYAVDYSPLNLAPKEGRVKAEAEGAVAPGPWKNISPERSSREFVRFLSFAFIFCLCYARI